MSIRSKVASSTLFLCVILILLSQIKTPFNFYDEGFTVFNATRIMNGDVPYKDFWSAYPPGQFYSLAAIFHTLGTNLYTARLYDTVVRFFIVIGIFLIAKRFTSHLSVFLLTLFSLP